MGTQVGSTRFESARHLVDEQFDALKDGVNRIYERVMKEPDGTPSKLSVWSAKATDAIKTHPYMAVGIALGIGYAVMKIARR